MANIPVEIWHLVRDESDPPHDVVLLRDAAGRILPIVIGICEAAAIWVRLEPEKSARLLRRPWTHDLMQMVLERLGGMLERVVIDDLANGTFFATLHINRQGREVVVDARPSDAIALLLRAPAILEINEEVMNQAAINPEGGEQGENDEGNDYWEELP